MIPKELKHYNQWVLWKYVERGGKKTKVPYSFKGYRASVTNPSDWGTYEDVHAQLVLDDHMHLGKYAGIGFVFTKNDPFIGIDWDHCVKDGIIEPEIYEEIKSAESYAEFSPSNTGVHCICRGVLPEKIKHRAHNREIYKSGRFFTVTENHIEGTPTSVNTIPAISIELILAKISPPDKPDIESVDWSEGEHEVDDKDAVRIVKALSSNKKFVELARGKFDRYKSQSEADFALCYLISAYTTNPALITYIFKKTKLYRQKFDGKYGKLTINAVLTARLLNEMREVL